MFVCGNKYIGSYMYRTHYPVLHTHLLYYGKALIYIQFPQRIILNEVLTVFHVLIIKVQPLTSEIIEDGWKAI